MERCATNMVSASYFASRHVTLDLKSPIPVHHFPNIRSKLDTDRGLRVAGKKKVPVLIVHGTHDVNVDLR